MAIKIMMNSFKIDWRYRDTDTGKINGGVNKHAPCGSFLRARTGGLCGALRVDGDEHAEDHCQTACQAEGGGEGDWLANPYDEEILLKIPQDGNT